MHRLEGDGVIDFDVVHSELTGLPLYVHDDAQLDRVIDECGRRARLMWRGFIITSSPTSAARRRFRETHSARSIVLRPWPGECLARLEASDRPESAKARLREYIGIWWDRFEHDYEAGQAEFELAYFALDGIAL